MPIFSIVFSGGPDNDSPDFSLGGDPSAHPVPKAPPNNLFANVTSEQSDTGLTNYICLYIFNDSGRDLNPVEISIKSQPQESEILLGISKASERQKVVIEGLIPVVGSVRLRYETGVEYTWQFLPSMSDMSAALQGWLRIADPIGSHVVNFFQNPQEKGFIIQWRDFRYHDVIQVVNRDLPIGAGFELTRVVSGTPINTISPQIAVGAAPNFVEFASDSVNVGYLKDGEGFPVWIRREIPEGSTSIRSDGFQISAIGYPL